MRNDHQTPVACAMWRARPGEREVRVAAPGRRGFEPEEPLQRGGKGGR